MKEIIIDGCNVAECECFAHHQAIVSQDGKTILKDTENACCPKQRPCIDIKNCCFKKQAKQLQRAKAEIKDLEDLAKTKEKTIRELQAEKLEWILKYAKYESRLEEVEYELEQYKKSKQASYEAMQIERNKAVNELKNHKAENAKLKAELDNFRRVD